MVTVQSENTFQRACGDGINLFVGSGFSCLAEDRSNHPLPTGGVLLAELIHEFKLVDAEGLSLAQVCTVLESEQKDQLYSFLTNRFSVAKFDLRYGALESLRIKTAFTTNIDDLLFKIFQQSDSWYLNDLAVRGPAFTDRSAIDFFALHGSIVHPGEPLTFSSTDLAAAFSADPDKWHFLTGQMQKFPTLFWGYSLSDGGILQSLNPITTRGRSHHDKWIVLREPTAADIRFFTALGFQIIQSDTAALLEYFADKIRPSRPSIPTARHTQDLFPEYSLPAPGSAPVRPLMDFFLGAPPAWPDIYSGRIPPTHHFAAVLDSINARADTVVLGMPTCGKTTLMMQLAAQVQVEGHKFVCNFLTEDNARLIVRKLQDERALIFVDDFADSVDAFNVLVDAKNVTAIGFDRDLNFEMASHKAGSLGFFSY